MKLAVTRQGKGPSLLLLHGLFGSGSNWLPIAKLLSDQFDVICPDLRNHGHSPHDKTMTFTAMAQDIKELNLGPCHILGHSMGGKVAMRFALDYPDLTQKLIVADIAPKAYGPLFPDLCNALVAIDLSKVKDRSEVIVSADAATQGLMQKNLRRDENGQFHWKINLEVLNEARGPLSSAIESKTTFDGPTLFLRGENSDYVSASDLADIKALFPAAQLETLTGAGHWLHAEKPEEFAETVRDFLLSNGNK